MCLQDGGIRRSETESRDVKLTGWAQLCCKNKFIITLEVSVITTFGTAEKCLGGGGGGVTVVQ